jgi:hypothetical protein
MSRWTSCASKRRFTEHEAERTAAKFGQRAYLCNRCTGWHCTKRDDNRPQVRTRMPDTPLVELARAKRALEELRRKNVKGELLEVALARVEELARLARQRR